MLAYKMRYALLILWTAVLSAQVAGDAAADHDTTINDDNLEDNELNCPDITFRNIKYNRKEDNIELFDPVNQASISLQRKVSRGKEGGKVYQNKDLRFTCGKGLSKFAAVGGSRLKVDPSKSMVNFALDAVNVNVEHKRAVQSFSITDGTKYYKLVGKHDVSSREEGIAFVLGLSGIKVRLQRSDIAAIEEALLDNRKPTKDQQESLKLARKVDMEALSDVEVIRAYINHLGSPIWRQAGNSILRIVFLFCAEKFIVPNTSLAFYQNMLTVLESGTDFYAFMKECAHKTLDEVKSEVKSCLKDQRFFSFLGDLAFLLGDYLLCELFSPKHLQNLESTHLLPLLYDRLSDMPEAFYNKYPVEKLDAALQNLKDNKLQDYLFERWQKTTSFWVHMPWMVLSAITELTTGISSFDPPILGPILPIISPSLTYLVCNIHPNIYEHWRFIVIFSTIILSLSFKNTVCALFEVLGCMLWIMHHFSIFQYDQFIRKEGAERLGKLAPILRMAYANPEKWKDVEMENAGAISEPTIKIEEDPTMEGRIGRKGKYSGISR